MGRRRKSLRPTIERVEPVVLLSNITNLMAINSHAVYQKAHNAYLAGGAPVAAASVASSQTGFVSSGSSIALPQNQGPQGTNLALQPVGNLSSHEQKRERFVATFKGNYTIGPGGFDSEAFQVQINAAGGANTMLHPDIQMRIITPKDPSVQLSGVSAIFDRNLNSNTSLGFDFSAPYGTFDSAGRPDHFAQVSTDVNISAGAYVESFTQGVIDIHYIPNSSKAKAPGVIEQGTAIVRIHAQIYSPRVAFLLANTNRNP